MSSYGAIDLSGTIASAKGVAACRPRSLTVYGRSTQDGTPTPEAPVAIESVDELALCTTGRNLILPLGDWYTSSGYTVVDGVLTKPTLSTAGWTQARCLSMPAATMYGLELTVSLEHRSDTDFSTVGSLTINMEGSASYRGTRTKYAKLGNNSTSPVPSAQWQRWSYTFTIPDESWFTSGSGTVDYIGVAIWSNTVYSYQIRNVQIELGSTATEYEPHASTTTPIDLQGHQLRSLPDGTRDELHIDARGNVTLTQRVGVTTQATTDGIVATVGTDAMSTTGDLSDGATVIYRLATPQTIGLGTVELPLLPSDLTVWTMDATEFEIRALLHTGHSPVMWDGEELSAGWVFVSDRHEQLLPRNVTTIDVPGRDGAIFGGVTQAVRQLTLSLYVLGRSDERAEHVRELAARLAVDEPRPLRFGDELTRMAIPNADVMSTVYFDAEGWVDVTFECPDPWLYGEVMTETLPSGGTLSITVGGTAPTWPTITANATGGSQGSWIVTLEDGTGIYAAIPSGTTHALTADCGARTLVVNEGVAMLPPSYDWPRLTPGTHTLTMAQGTGDATVTWVERWW